MSYSPCVINVTSYSAEKWSVVAIPHGLHKAQFCAYIKLKCFGSTFQSAGKNFYLKRKFCYTLATSYQKSVLSGI